MNQAIIKAKRIECVIGLFLLLPPILGVIAFVLQIFEADTDFSMMRELSLPGLLNMTKEEACLQLQFI